MKVALEAICDIFIKQAEDLVKMQGGDPDDEIVIKCPDGIKKTVVIHAKELK